MTPELASSMKDPLRFAKVLWPKVKFYRQQREMIYSTLENDETVVVAGNMLGKDYVAGFIALYFFMTRQPCRIVTTSAKDDHLRVLWGEIGQFITTASVPLDNRRGGPLIVKHHDIRRQIPVEPQLARYAGECMRCPLSYLIGMVASADTIAAMQGHHVAATGDKIPRTLWLCDEASSVGDAYYKMVDTWANRKLVFGNPWPCSNFFYKAVKGTPPTAESKGDPGGDRPRPVKRSKGEEPGARGYYRKVIRIQATDSPNVRLALVEKEKAQEHALARGLSWTAEDEEEFTPSGRMLIPGVKGWEEYQRNLATWDPIQVAVSLLAEFYEGVEVRMFPREWLDLSEELASIYEEDQTFQRTRQAKALGVDPGEGVANTAIVVVDEYGVLDRRSHKTPNTAIIVNDIIEAGELWDIPSEMWGLDRGGGGLQIADQLRARGYHVRTIGFGESSGTPDPRSWMTTAPERLDQKEDHYAHMNRRAEMYGCLMRLLDPGLAKARGRNIFAIPARFREFRAQLGPIPKMYDSEGRLKMLPKHKRNPDSPTEKCLVDLIGCSPDEADALVLAVYLMVNPVPTVTVQVVS